jgi:Fe-S-cluster containining protein
MIPSLTDTLCTQCGLCCDGSLFADVELAGRAEATRLEAMGLAIEDDDGEDELMPLPCSALRGTRCSVYAHRPKCCRTFECRLLQQVRRGTLVLERAAEKIADARAGTRRVSELLSRLGQRGGTLPLRERCAEALSREAHAEPEMNRLRTELEAAMATSDKFIGDTFLGRRKPLLGPPRSR